MIIETVPILFKRTKEPGHFGGVPNRDLTQADWDRLPPTLRRDVEHSALYAAAELTPAQKGAQTRRENEQRETAEREAAALAAAEADAAAKQAAHETGATGTEDGN